MPTSAEVVYLDSSALVKLVVDEAETAALRRQLRRRRTVSCAIARVEVVRAVRRHGPRVVATARAALAEIDLVGLDDALLSAAADLAAPDLRSLDAIHVAASMTFGGRLEALVTYDERMRRAAVALGLPVASPR